MKTILSYLSTLIVIFTFSISSMACSPCGALSNVTQTINGTNLELTFTSNAGWECCYTVQIEIICANLPFTGVPNYFSQEVCINGGTGPSTINNTPTPYPLTVIDISNFCPGDYKWRAVEQGALCNVPTATFNFTVAGASPIVLNLSQVDSVICDGDNTQFTALATGGCNNGTMNYSWSPATGLSNPNIANPVASPSSTTTYTCTVTESGSCTLPQTATMTLTVNPLPTATISGTVEVCHGDPSPTITFTGADATGPYIINYTLNGIAQAAVVTVGGTATIAVPTNIPGTYVYSLVDVQESSNTQCSQTQGGTATVIVNPLPNVVAGPDQTLCEPNPTSPSEITLNGSGAVSYVWDNGAVNGVPFIPPSGTTVFTVTGTDANGCTNTDQLTVVSLTLPIANGTASDIFGNLPFPVDFTNESLYATSYTWDFGDNNIINTTSMEMVSNTYLLPGVYTVTLTASNGICFDTWTIEIVVIPPMVVTPPNIFTPNGDGDNDNYFVIVENGEKFESIIVNRWGNLMATMAGVNQGWNGSVNGKDVEDGVYYVKYKATDFAGVEIEGHAYFHLVR